jgi:hypothetical protein
LAQSARDPDLNNIALLPMRQLRGRAIRLFQFFSQDPPGDFFFGFFVDSSAVPAFPWRFLRRAQVRGSALEPCKKVLDRRRLV